MSCPEFLILRHGETEWNLAGRLQGDMDSELTETGRAQAARQCEILADFGVKGWTWYASPQGRAMKTARIAAQGISETIIQDTRLREIGLGDWAGMLRKDLMQQNPMLFETDGLGWYDHVPGGEGLLALEQRARDFLQDLRGPSVIVTHGITSRVIRCVAQGLPVEEFDRLDGGQGVIYRIRNRISEKLS